VVSLLSAVPTIEFLSWRKAVKAGQEPSPAPAKLTLVRRINHIELMGVVVILLAAAITARGGWH
jgi:putative membrane protein